MLLFGTVWAIKVGTSLKLTDRRSWHSGSPIIFENVVLRTPSLPSIRSKDRIVLDLHAT